MCWSERRLSHSFPTLLCLGGLGKYSGEIVGAVPFVLGRLD